MTCKNDNINIIYIQVFRNSFNSAENNCENRDSDFDQKMQYKQLSLQFDEKGQLIPFKEDEQVIYVLSYDEKPWIQASWNCFFVCRN